jgi:hypothetical protein
MAWLRGSPGQPNLGYPHQFHPCLAACIGTFGSVKLWLVACISSWVAQPRWPYHSYSPHYSPPLPLLPPLPRFARGLRRRPCGQAPPRRPPPAMWPSYAADSTARPCARALSRETPVAVRARGTALDAAAVGTARQRSSRNRWTEMWNRAWGAALYLPSLTSSLSRVRWTVATASCSPSCASLSAGSSDLALLHLELFAVAQLCGRAHLRGGRCRRLERGWALPREAAAAGRSGWWAPPREAAAGRRWVSSAVMMVDEKKVSGTTGLGSRKTALLEMLLRSVSRNAAWDSILHNLSLHNTPMQPTNQQWVAFQKPR